MACPGGRSSYTGPGQPHRAAELISFATGTSFRFERTLVGGETGANLFSDGGGVRWVVKWVDHPGSIQRRRAAVEVSERLRVEAAWPTPHRFCVTGDGWLFVLQRFVPGDVHETVSAAVVDELLEAHNRRRGLAVAGSSGFADHLLETLAVGGTSYCLHAPMRAHSGRGARFIDRIEELAGSIRPGDLPSGDLIHWDLHPGNLVVDRSGLVAVIDWDHAKEGDGLADLVCLAMSARGAGTDAAVQEHLRAEVIAPLDELRSAAYVGHYALRFGDWAVRHGRADEVEQWLDLADAWM